MLWTHSVLCLRWPTIVFEGACVCPCIPPITVSVSLLVSSMMLHLLKVEFSSPLKTFHSPDITRRHPNPFLLNSWLYHWRSPGNLGVVEMYHPDYIQHRLCYCAWLARQGRAVWGWEASPCPEAAPISQFKCFEKTGYAWVAVQYSKTPSCFSHFCFFILLPAV